MFGKPADKSDRSGSRPPTPPSGDNVRVEGRAECRSQVGDGPGMTLITMYSRLDPVKPWVDDDAKGAYYGAQDNIEADREAIKTAGTVNVVTAKASQ